MLTRFALLSKKHFLAIIFAVITGAIIVGPQLIFIVNEGAHYRGFYMMETEAETHYLARMHEFYDEGKIGNPYLYDYKYYGPQFFPSLAEVIVAFPGKLLGISVPTLNLIDKFVFPAIAFLLIYGFVFRLTGHRGWSIAGGLGVILGIVFLYAGDLLHLFRLEFVYNQFVYNRPINPQFSEILFWAYLHILLSCYERKGWRWFVVLGALFALSFYTYFFSFAFFIALNGVFFLLWLWRGENDLAKKMFVTSIVALALGSYSLLRIYLATRHPDYGQLANANFMERGHIPEFSKQGLLVLGATLGSIYFLRKRNAFSLGTTHIFFLCGIFATTLVVINQQVITGVALQSGHFHWVFNIPFFMVSWMILGWLWSTYFSCTSSFVQKALRVLPYFFSILFIVAALMLQYSSYQYWAPVDHEKQRVMPIFVWLEENTPKDSVVMANQQLSNLIPVFTANNVMWEGNNYITCCYFVPSDRAAFTPEAVLKDPDFFHAIRRYRLDYIVWDRKVDPSWAIDRLKLPLLFAFDGLEIYQLPG